MLPFYTLSFWLVVVFSLGSVICAVHHFFRCMHMPQILGEEIAVYFKKTIKAVNQPEKVKVQSEKDVKVKSKPFKAMKLLPIKRISNQLNRNSVPITLKENYMYDGSGLRSKSSSGDLYGSDDSIAVTEISDVYCDWRHSLYDIKALNDLATNKDINRTSTKYKSDAIVHYDQSYGSNFSFNDLRPFIITPSSCENFSVLMEKVEITKNIEIKETLYEESIDYLTNHKRGPIMEAVN